MSDSNIKFGWSEYWKPTPENVRKMADAIVVATTFSGALTSLNDKPEIGTAIFVLGFLAKIISNFFSKP
jgi:hypothetical protein